MAVGMYEGPAEQKFVDTYAPLPFQEMMQVGQAFQRERERTEEEMREFRSEFADFTTPSTTDAASMDQITYGAVRPYIDKMRVDPEAIRSQEFQSQVKGAMQSINRREVAMLRQGAENARERQKTIAKLQAEGRYKESWDPYGPVSQWDTLKQGPIPVDVMEYKTVEEISTPVVADLLKHGSYLGHTDRDHYMHGVTEKDIRASINDQFDSIMATPQGQKHLEDTRNELIAAGITDPAITRDVLVEKMVQAQRQKTWQELKLDPTAREREELYIKRQAAAAKRQAGSMPLLTDQLIADAKNKMDMLGGLLNQNPTIQQRNAALDKALADARATGNRDAIKKAEDAIANRDVENFNYLSTQAFATGAGITDPSKPITAADAVDGAAKVKELYSTTASSTGLDAILSQTGGHEDKGAYTFNSLSDFKTDVDLVRDVVDFKLPRKKDDLGRLLESGVINNARVSASTQSGNVYNVITPSGEVKQYASYAVQFTDKDINPNALRRALYGNEKAGDASLTNDAYDALDKAIRDNRGDIFTKGTTVKRSTTGSQRTTIQKKTLTSESETVSESGEPVTTYTIWLNKEIPRSTTPGGSQITAAINDAHFRRITTKAKAGEEHSGDVEDAFSDAQRAAAQRAAALQQFGQ